MVVVPRDDADRVSYHQVNQIGSTLDDSRHSTFTKNRAERDRVVEDLKQLKKGYNYQETGDLKTKPNILEVYVANVGKETKDEERSTASKGKKVVIKPDCGKLTDGITEDLDDDTVSKIYDDLLLKLGFGDGESPLTTTESSKEIADYQNPFKFGYLKAAKPSRSQRFKAECRRVFKTIGNVLTRPFLMCRNSQIQPDIEE